MNSTLYNSLGAITEINFGNGAKTTFGYYGTGGAYDTNGGYYGQLYEAKTFKASDVLQDTLYAWDSAGNLIRRQNQGVNQIEYFAYDFLDRLINTSGIYSEAYTYDALGNIISKGGTNYVYGSSRPYAVTGVGAIGYTYDLNGNMESGDGRSITWDAENRPVSITKDGVTTTFGYDGDGSRVKQTVAGVTTIYVNRYYEKTGAEVTTNYYFGSRLIAVKTGAALSYIMQDHLGSTSGSAAANGTLTGTISYFSFGAIRFSTGPLPTDKKFTGQRLDSTGLYYYNARYFDPEIGRFISPDTIVPDSKNPQALNRYSYVLNNPLKYTDPSGHMDNYDLGLPDDWDDYTGYRSRGGDTSYDNWHSGQVFVQTLKDFAFEAIKSNSCQIITADEVGQEDADWGTWEDLPYLPIKIVESLDKSIVETYNGYADLTQTSDGRTQLTAAGLFIIISGGKGKGSTQSTKLFDGARMPTSKALDTAEKFLGPGYRDMGNGRFLSVDGTKQVRMGDSDIAGLKPHINFEILGPNPAKSGRMIPIRNMHIFLEDP